MRLELCLDMALVKRIMTEPDIWERAAEDGVDADKWYPGTNEMTIWLLCVEDDGIGENGQLIDNNKIIGIILVHTDNSVSVKIHPYLRSKHREKGRSMMKEFYKWFLANTKEDCNKINVSIPTYHTRVINFAKKVGFQKEGINRDSYQKGGQLYGQQNLGITRKEIGEYLDVCDRRSSR